jgi:hypothetical protein
MQLCVRTANLYVLSLSSKLFLSLGLAVGGISRSHRSYLTRRPIRLRRFGEFLVRSKVQSSRQTKTENKVTREENRQSLSAFRSEVNNKGRGSTWNEGKKGTTKPSKVQRHLLERDRPASAKGRVFLCTKKRNRRKDNTLPAGQDEVEDRKTRPKGSVPDGGEKD